MTDPDGGMKVDASPLSGSDMPWMTWLKFNYPSVCTYDFAPRHEQLWGWIEALEQGVRPRPYIAIWGRGGGKSATVELGCVRVGAKLSRRFCLYVCETQEQADRHVQSISTLFENLGVERALGKYGHSKGWRRNQLRTANGYNVAALGLDTSARGIKLDEFRPDFIIFDDVDNTEDSIRTLDKKIRHITKKILPAGSTDLAVLGMQNLIHEDSIFARMLDKRADFLYDRIMPGIEPAVRNLEYQIVQNEDGLNYYKITGGEATWVGQSIEACQNFISTYGWRAFLEECQHEVAGAGGYVFNTSQFRYCTIADLPQLTSVCLAWDLAATEGGGDHTVGVLMGKDANDLYYVLAVIRGQWGSERVRQAIDAASAFYKGIFPRLILRLPQDPGQAGVAQKNEMRKGLADYGPIINPVTGKKATRASNYAEAVNLGNVFLLQEDLPDCLAPLIQDRRWQTWQTEYRFVLKRFDENVTDQPDDDVDASSDAYNQLAKPRLGKAA